MANHLAMSAVRKAVMTGELPNISTQTCVDCGSPAEHYDHRDYNKPLEVEPVCRTCNYRRGPAIPGPVREQDPLTKSCGVMVRLTATQFKKLERSGR